VETNAGRGAKKEKGASSASEKKRCMPSSEGEREWRDDFEAQGADADLFYRENEIGRYFKTCQVKISPKGQKKRGFRAGVVEGSGSNPFSTKRHDAGVQLPGGKKVKSLGAVHYEDEKEPLKEGSYKVGR